MLTAIEVNKYEGKYITYTFPRNIHLAIAKKKGYWIWENHLYYLYNIWGFSYNEDDSNEKLTKEKGKISELI